MPAKTHTPLSNALVKTKIDMKAVKMVLYGAIISAPMGHILVGILQKAFAGKTSMAARFGQVIASNIFVAPIQAAGDIAHVCSRNVNLTPPFSLSRVHGHY